MKIGMDNFHKLLVALLLALMTLAAGRGLLRTTPLAGHDVPAYPVNQAQFMDNLRDGVLFPRWSPDTRHGYGQPRLQFRPPLLHYLASPLHAATNNPFLALNLVLLGCLFMAAWGAYALARLRVGEGAALVAAAGFVCANYMLANLYLRGAYYEVVASAVMPWILWAQSRENVACLRARLIGPVAWAALLMAHPAVGFFFLPLAVVHALSESRLSARSGRARCWSIAVYSAVFLGVGLLLSAPYTWVMLAERPWVRMEIFITNLDSWRRHFFSLYEWFTERWPDAYVEYRGVDYLRRALHPEMRGLNLWAMAVVIFSPLVWWLTLRNRRRNESADKTCTSSETSIRVCHSHENGNPDVFSEPGFPIRSGMTHHKGFILSEARHHQVLRSYEILFGSVFFYAAAWLLVALSLRLSLPVWNHISIMETFNFPWRVLTVVGLCLALAAAYGAALLSEIIKQRGHRLACMIPVALLVLAPLAEAIPHTGGWPGPVWLTYAELTSSAIQRHAGIPLQYYTPTWVRRYATEPAPTDAQVVEGSAQVTVTERRPTRWRLRVEASTPARIVLSHYYYPGWRIHGTDSVIRETEPWTERALISFTVPPGTHALEARFGSTPARRAANGGFTAGLALMLFGVLMPRRKSSATEPSRRSAPPTSANIEPEVARPLCGRVSLHAFVFSTCAVVLMVGVIILTDYLVRARDDETSAVQAGQQLVHGDNLAAIHSYARLLRERETDIAARYSLGAAYHNYGWHDEALVSYDDVLKQANEYAARAAHSAARISLLRKDFERARLYYEAALKYQPDAEDIRAEYEQLMALRRKAGVRKDVSFP